MLESNEEPTEEVTLTDITAPLVLETIVTVNIQETMSFLG